MPSTIGTFIEAYKILLIPVVLRFMPIFSNRSSEIFLYQAIAWHAPIRFCGRRSKHSIRIGGVAYDLQLTKSPSWKRLHISMT